MKCVVLSTVLFAAYTHGFLFPKIKTVDELEISKYLGQWYEMYSSLIQRSTFQKDSYCTSAIYTLKADMQTINVYNSGRISSPTGRLNAINGTATRPDAKGHPGEVIVNFPGTPQSSKPNYLVIKLGPVVKGKYEYTIITSPFKALSWILARDPKEFRAKYEAEAIKFMQDNGFTYFWNRPRKTYQEDDCIYPNQEQDNQILIFS